MTEHPMTDDDGHRHCERGCAERVLAHACERYTALRLDPAPDAESAAVLAGARYLAHEIAAHGVTTTTDRLLVAKVLAFVANAIGVHVMTAHAGAYDASGNGVISGHNSPALAEQLVMWLNATGTAAGALMEAGK